MLSEMLESLQSQCADGVHEKKNEELIVFVFGSEVIGQKILTETFKKDKQTNKNLEALQ